MNKPQVIAKVVDNDLCTGCGVCTYSCSSNALTMDWNEEGFLVPGLTGDCDDDSSCISVCPFNPQPIEAVKNETAIADIFLTDSTEEHDKLGRLIGIYAAHSNEFREHSSSGGMGSYIFSQLLDRGIVDHVFSVSSSDTVEEYYQYSVSSSKADLRKASKTKYYPVTLATVLSEIDHLEGKVAVVGVACFVKAIRLAQYQNPFLKEKIPFVAGIICGGVKSKFFTEYLADKAGADYKNIESPRYRIKDPASTANNYSFGCIDTTSKEYKKIKMREVGDMWGTGLFKANACDFCDDVVTELADISLGDAWLEPYSLDGRGTSVIVTRSPMAELIVQEGMEKSEIVIESISPDTMRASQQGSYNHRHEGLYVRLKEARAKGIPIAEKRYGKKPVSPDVFIVQVMRRLTRKKSLKVWSDVETSADFDKKMEKILSYLKLSTKVTQYRRGALRRVKGLLK